MSCRTWKSVLVLLLFAGVAWSQETPFSTDSLDIFVRKTMREWQVPGLALALVKDGTVIYAQGYGVRDLGSRQAVTTRTLFSLASSSKAFTSTLAAMLVQDSLIRWDTPLQSYFPEFTLYDSLAAQRVTLRDLLAHRTGVPEQEFFRVNEPSSREEVLRRMRYFEPNQDFRSAWNYNNLGYTVAGTMLARRAGKSWEELLRARILEPLAMHSTRLSIHDLHPGTDCARPYIVYDSLPEPMEFYDADVLGPAGCILSNVEDMSHWLLFHLNKGVVDGTPLVRADLLAETRKPQIPMPARGSREILCPAYGMGWMIDAYRGHLRVNHGGLLFGFTALVSTMPDDQIGLVVLTNLNNTPLPSLVESYVYDRLLGLSPVDWNQRKHDAFAKLDAMIKAAESRPDPDRHPEAPHSHPLPDYAGRYHSDGYGDIVIRQDGDTLRARLTTIECPLLPYNADTFELFHRVKRASWPVTFHNDAAGRVHDLSVTIAPDVNDIVFLRADPAPAN